MSQSFGEKLRSTSLAVKEHNARLSEEAALMDLTETGLSSEEEGTLVSEFVDQHLAMSIYYLKAEAERRAGIGDWSANITWGFNAKHDDPELPKMLLERRGLRAKVIEHFTDIGVVASEIDTRSGYPWKVDDPYSEVKYEWIQSPCRVIGVRLSWDDPAKIALLALQSEFPSASDVREHLGADSWIGQGQASPL